MTQKSQYYFISYGNIYYLILTSMWLQEPCALPIYSLAKPNLLLAAHQMIECTSPDPEWKDRCQVLLRYLQTHDLTRMPEALHQRLYTVLKESVKVLGDNLPRKRSQHDWLDIDYNQQELLKSSVLSPPAEPTLQAMPDPLESSLERVSENYSQTSVEQILLREEIQLEDMARLREDLRNKVDIITKREQQLQEIKEFYREAVLEGENYLLDQFKAKQELNRKLSGLEEELIARESTIAQKEQQITRLKLLLEKAYREAEKLDLNLIKERSSLKPLEDNSDDTLTMHSMTRPTVPESSEKLKRKPSISVQSCDQADTTAFETQSGSEASFRHNERLNLLHKRIEDLENDLKMKDEVLSAINNFIDNEGESILGEKSSLTELLKHCQLKQKYKSYCSLAEENAYLKQCMDKLTKSEEFWAKVHGKEESKEDERKKCLIF